MKFNINTRIDISFTEEQITEALTALITAEMPGIEVESIEYIAKRNPSRTEAVVNAKLEGYTEQKTSSEHVPEQQELDLELPKTREAIAEPEMEESSEVPTTVEDIFNIPASA